MYFKSFVIRFTFINFLYFVNGAVPDIKASNEGCSAKIAACETNNNNSRRPVCGTDGRTYPTRCQLLREQCAGEPVAVAHKGPCSENSGGQSVCLLALKYALKARANKITAFVPRCRPDGSYAAVQCAAAGVMAGCWCVTPAGKPLPDTAVRNRRPDCTKTGYKKYRTIVHRRRAVWETLNDPTFLGKSHTRRRSSARGQRNKRNCNLSDRTLFNANLIKIFSGEYDRVRARNAGTSPGHLDPRSVAVWKFGELDRDRSGTLKKPEYRGLRRLIKKVVKPKRCSRTWARDCDANKDGSIGQSEWLNCLLAAPQPPTPDYEEGGPEPEHDYGDEELPIDPSSVLPGSLMRGAPDELNVDPKRDDDNNDCLTDRQAVLDEQKAGGSALYVPECTGDGRYARAQCYKSTGYCWCVHQDTGKPIPGSSVKDRRPDCDSAPQHASPMRGCPEPMKSNFLRELRNFFISKMATTTNGTVPGSGEMVKWSASREEHAATWVFVMLDKDKNKVLERREWKAFHQLISNVEELRRCGRKLPRYCDVNHDNKISITEWLACLEVMSAAKPPSTELPKPSNSRRKGPNPLESILKADD